MIKINTTVDINVLINDALEWLSTVAVKVILGLIILLIVFKVINRVSKMLNKALLKRKIDQSIINFTTTALRKLFKLLVFIIFLGFVGIDTAGIAACVATIGVAIGLALQGSLSNLAGGIMIIITRPFKLGDLIESEDNKGTVEEINLFYTHLVTFDNKVVFIPNGNLANKSIVNYSTKETRRVDLIFSISYNNDYVTAKKLIEGVISTNNLILINKDSIIRMSAHSDSSIDIFVGVWTDSINFWEVHSRMLIDVKEIFDKKGIEIPYKQVDIHI